MLRLLAVELLVELLELTDDAELELDLLELDEELGELLL